MASKPESNYIKRVHKEVDKLMVYHEKMHNMYRGGTADVWYSGIKGDLWIEYKWLSKIPKRIPIIPDLSQLQHEWLKAREEEGRNVWVIIGTPEGGFLFRAYSIVREVQPSVFRSMLRSPVELAGLIHAITGASPCLSRPSSSQLPASFRRRTKSLPRLS